jgi:hypothetical protein
LTRPLPRLSATSIASIARTFSVVRKADAEAVGDDVEHLRGPVGDATSRSACTRVKPLAESHCLDLGRGRRRRQFHLEGDDFSGAASPPSPRRHAAAASACRSLLGESWRNPLRRSACRTARTRARTAASGGRSARSSCPTVERELRTGLVWSDGDRRRHALDLVDRRPVHALEELARG